MTLIFLEVGPEKNTCAEWAVWLCAHTTIEWHHYLYQVVTSMNTHASIRTLCFIYTELRTQKENNNAKDPFSFRKMRSTFH